MNPVDMTGDVAIVTGASRGLGAEAAKALAAAGAHVVLVARDVESLEGVRKEIEATSPVGRVLVFQVDVSDRGSIDAMVTRTLDEFGRIHAVVNNAGIVKIQKFLEIEEQDFQQIMDVNLMGPVRLIQAVGQHMIDHSYGRIVNISSIAGIRGRTFEAHYSASKGALNMLTLSLAIEWARFGINVNAICPGYMLTSVNEAQLEDPKLRSVIESRIPQKRIGDAAEIAAPVTFLASRGASYVTGTVLSLDGGTAAR